ncbi:MAG: ribosome maturation factor RimP [Termitinemataceae bacterium]|nr:MAG: ribosome maturation factor RimP [Termitinemataceae bacterium]
MTSLSSEPVFGSLEPVVKGLGMGLVELVVSKQKASVQVRLVVYKNEAIGIDDCSKVHRAVTPRLELAFPGRDVYIEVSSPGIDRLIKDGHEFVHYVGHPIRCYQPEISDWVSGILEQCDDTHIELKTNSGKISLTYDQIAKAKLNSRLVE